MHMQVSGQGAAPIDGFSSAWAQIAVFASAVDASLGRWLVDTHQIGLTEYRALAHLAQAADKELRVNDLAQRLGLNQSSVTRLVSRLEAKGLTRRDICPDDGRGVYAVITEQGEALLQKVRGPYEEQIRDLLSDVAALYPQLDASQLSRALSDIGNAVTP